jgi:hypothetical protein
MTATVQVNFPNVIKNRSKRPKPGTANHRRSTYYRVLMRNMNPGPRLNKWEPITTHGFQVTCQSYLEASELVLFVGGPLHPRPSAAMEDDAYERWLLKRWFLIEPWVPGHPFDDNGINPREMEITFGAFIRGWYPAAEDIPGILGEGRRSGVEMMAERIVRDRWKDR